MNRPDDCIGVLARIEPEVASVDTVKTCLNTVLPRVVPGAVFGQASLSVRAAQWMNVGTKSGSSVVLEDDPARIDFIDEKTTVFDT